MKIRSLFNLIQDAQDVAYTFEKVESPEQMVSMLERIKKQGAVDFLENIQALRLSLEALLGDMLEVDGRPSDYGDELDVEGDDGEDLLGSIGDEEEPVPTAGTESQETKSEEA